MNNNKRLLRIVGIACFVIACVLEIYNVLTNHSTTFTFLGIIGIILIAVSYNKSTSVSKNSKTKFPVWLIIVLSLLALAVVAFLALPIYYMISSQK